MNSPFDRKAALERIVSARRVVIKVGTSLLTSDKDSQGINRGMIEKLCDEIVFLRKKGVEVVLVSSGAVGLGRAVLRDIPPPTSNSRRLRSPAESSRVSRKQALAALGQGRLISVYADVFGGAGIAVAQLLLTARDFRDRRAYLNIGHTLQELMALGALPIVNENDTVSTEELRFGDNDLLSAACASLFKADLLVILTSVEGFLMDGKRQPFLSDVTRDVMREAHGPSGPGSGGMQTKIRAGQLCLMTGEVLSILPGRHHDPIQALFRGEDLGTVMAAKDKNTLSARKRWLLFARTEGAVVVDDGARKALTERGSSLLPAGISRVQGRFLAGDVVEIEDAEGLGIGRGIINFSSRELEGVVGLSGPEITRRSLLHGPSEVIHRDNLILEVR